MYAPVYELASFEDFSDEEKVAVLRRMLEGLILANVLWLRKHPECPPLYTSGIPYIAEPPGRDNWQDIPRTLDLHEGDCEDLATWRVAELIVRGDVPGWWNGYRGSPPEEGAHVDITHRSWMVKRGRYTLFHIRVRRADGRIEDPSRDLGMV